MRVTIIADASRDPASGVSGYGGWIASDRGRMKVGGAFRLPMDSVAASEMGAIVNVVHRARKSGLLLDGDDVLIRTDCMDAIFTIKGHRNPQTNDERMIEAAFHDVTSGLKRVSFKHVKGHTSGRTAAHASNNHCDEEAKRHMRAKRKAIT